MSVSTALMLVIVLLVAVIFKLMGRTVLCFAIVALFGALAGNIDGPIGDTFDTASSWVLGFPGWLVSVLG
jgi:hypothetical protein